MPARLAEKALSIQDILRWSSVVFSSFNALTGFAAFASHDGTLESGNRLGTAPRHRKKRNRARMGTDLNLEKTLLVLASGPK